MNRLLLVCAAGLLVAGCDSANTPTNIPGNGQTQTTNTNYDCGSGGKLAVTYLNNDPNAIAIVETGDNQKIMMVNVVAASGAKYVGGIWEWWTKNESGTLSNIQTQKTMECQEAK